jgi:type I restriction enzyme S subunit
MPNGYKETKIGKIPEEWDVVRFHKCLNKAMHKDPSIMPEEKFTYIDVSAVSNKLFKITDSKRLLGKDAPGRARKEVKHGDTIYATIRPYLKRVAYISEEFDKEICSTGYCVLHPNVDFVEPKFVFQLMLTQRVNQYLKSLQVGTSYPAIKDSDIYQMLIPLPVLSEQQKIAEILSTVDESIEKTDTIIEETRQLKKGLMDKTIFGGFNNSSIKELVLGPRYLKVDIPKHWELNDLEGITSEKISYGVVTAKERELGVPMVRSGGIDSTQGILDNIKHIDKDDEKNYSKTRLYGGEILMALVGATIGLVGVAPKFTKGYNVSRAVAVLRLKVGIDSNYIKYLLRSNIIQKKIQIMTSGSAQPVINLEQLRKLPVLLPPLKEQQYISRILLEVDSKIEKEEAMKSELEQLKKGLMQVLLTGKVRVKA